MSKEGGLGTTLPKEENTGRKKCVVGRSLKGKERSRTWRRRRDRRKRKQDAELDQEQQSITQEESVIKIGKKKKSSNLLRAWGKKEC